MTATQEKVFEASISCHNNIRWLTG